MKSIRILLHEQIKEDHNTPESSNKNTKNKKRCSGINGWWAQEV